MLRGVHGGGNTSFVIWDLEFTAWEGSAQRSWLGFVPGTTQREHREVIQIAALWVTLRAPESESCVMRHCHHSWTVISKASLHLYVKPFIHHELSPYIQQLTHITQDKIDREGVELQVAMFRFLEFIRHHQRADPIASKLSCVPMLSWGNDWDHLEQSMRLHQKVFHSELWSLRPCARDAREILWSAGFNTTGWSSGTIHRHPQISAATAGHVHDASWDTESVLLALQALARRGGRALHALKSALGVNTRAS